MKRKLITTLILLIICGTNIFLAQQFSRHHPFDKRKNLMQYPGMSDNFFRDMKISKNTPPYQDRFEENPLLLNLLIPDFQVNENAGTRKVADDYCSVAMDVSGNFVVVWSNDRNGGGEYDVYAQRYLNDGTPLGGNFKVSGDENNTTYSILPSISMDTSGNFVIVWNAYWDIYARRYLSDGSPIGPSFQVNDGHGSAVWNKPTIAIGDNGDFIITWADIRNSVENLYAQRYSSDGIPIGNNFKVNDVQGSAHNSWPSIAMDGYGNFIITWGDNYEIYAQRYSKDGTTLGTNYKVNDDIGPTLQLRPSIALDVDGNFIITWLDNYEIYAQRYSKDGTTLGTNFKVNDLEGSCFCGPSVSIDGAGNFMIVWDWHNGDYERDVYAQRYSSAGNPLGNNFRINDAESTFYSYCAPAIATDGYDNFVFVWGDIRNGDWPQFDLDDLDIYAQRYTIDAIPIGNNFKVNDDEVSSDQFIPSIDTDSSGNFVVTWVDERNGNGDIYAQRFSSDGTALGNNIKVNDSEDSHASHWSTPSVASDIQGNFLITWSDIRNSTDSVFRDDIYAQRYLSDGTPIGNNFKVNDHSARATSPSIATDGSGYFVITWVDDFDDVYAQIFSIDGVPVGNNFMVNDDGNYVDIWSPPSVSANKDGFVIVWGDSYSVYVQRFLSDGTKIGTNISVKNNGYVGYHTSISLDANSNFVVIWPEFRNDVDCLYARRYSSDGTPFGPEFKVNDEDYGWFSEGNSVSSDAEGNFIITWDETLFFYVGGRNSNVHAQRYLSDGSRLGDNFLIPASSKRTQCEPSVKLLNGKIYTAWMDNHVDGTGFNIWANVLDWDQPVSVNEKEISEVPSEFQLYQNYPNPFNPSTKIKYSLPAGRQGIPKQSNVILKVFDVLGREVETLVQKIQSQGNYKIEFDGSDLTSGIYFYRMKAVDPETSSGQVFVETKKMILIK